LALPSSTPSSQNLLPSILYFITAFFHFQTGPQEIREVYHGILLRGVDLEEIRLTGE
jgi:hypothetical protein